MPEASSTLRPAQVQFVRRAEAAAYIRTTYGFPCSPRWLAKLAVVGGGPPFHKAGRTPVYALADLDEWALNRLGGVYATTREHERAKGPHLGEHDYPGADTDGR